MKLIEIQSAIFKCINPNFHYLTNVRLGNIVTTSIGGSAGISMYNQPVPITLQGMNSNGTATTGNVLTLGNGQYQWIPVQNLGTTTAFAGGTSITHQQYQPASFNGTFGQFAGNSHYFEIKTPNFYLRKLLGLEMR